jgi:ELWxxDGT repeat protein
MSRIASALLVLSGLALASPVPAVAQTAYLVKDITSGSRFPAGSSPKSLWSFQGKVLFSAEEPSTGRELWITDGNGSGTRLLAEFCPGTCSSSPIPLGTAHSLLFGIAFPNISDSPFDPQIGYLWRSDGTREGTFLLPDSLNQVALPFASDFFDPVDGPQVPIVFGPDVAYFAACNNSLERCGVWRTDGSAAGTIKLHEFPGSLAASDLTLVGSRLFFASYQQLWTSDGTAEGTVPVRDFPSATPRHLAALGNKVLFLAPAASPATGEELWVTDGTAAGTRALTSFEVAQPFRQTHFLKTLGNKVYFVADDVTHGAEIWTSDGTSSGTVRVTDFGFHNPFGWEEGFSDGGLFSWQIDKLGDRLVFSATDGISDFQPWSNQGSPASTTPICPTCTSSTGLRFQPLNGKLVFVGEAGFNGSSVWATDGTALGTRLLTQQCNNCNPQLGAVPGAVFFPGPSLGSLRATLWTSDGTPQGTRLFAAVNPLAFQSSVQVALLGGKVLFNGWTDNPEDSDQRDEELWSGDGTPDGTRLVADINRSGNPSKISQLVAAGDRLFFTASNDLGDSSYVWSSQGTAASTLKSFSPFFSDFGVTSRLAVGGGKVFLIRALYSEGEQLWGVGTDGQTQPLTSFPENYTIRDPVSFLGRLYFGVVHGVHVPGELWQSDGTVLGTHKALDLPAEIEDLRWLRVVGSEIWFLAAHDFNESSIWHTNGTTLGTRKVLDSFLHPDVDPEFTQVGLQVYFIVDNPGGDDFDYQIWRSDGTPAHTEALFSSSFPPPSLPAGLTAFQGNLFFFGNLAGERALWRTDSEGTAVVHQFPRQPSPGFSSLDTPRLPITVLGSRLVFAVDDGVHGSEPWSSDGTAAGTALLRDVRPGLSGSGVTGFTAAAGQLYFAADDGGHGSEVWRTDGTPAGTRLVQDLNPEGASSYPAGFTVVGNLLYFSADDGITGNELWALPLAGPACQAGATALCLNNGRFRVEAHWKVPNSEGSGQAVPLSTDTGYFWFFDPANVEAILKVLDATTFNGHFWVFYGALSNVEYSLTVTDTQTGLARRYFNPQGQFASVGDTNGFGLLGAHDRKSLAAPAAPPLLVSERTDPAAATGTCVPGASRLCLSNGRFAVESAWKDFTGRTGTGTAVGLTGDTGYFWFFDPANVEAVLKVLDATTFNGHFWVFYGALSNVEYTLTVTDTMTGAVKTYRNPSGRFASAGDVTAF